MNDIEARAIELLRRLIVWRWQVKYEESLEDVMDDAEELIREVRRAKVCNQPHRR